MRLKTCDILNITNFPKFLQIRRWYHQRGIITDITKTGCQVKKILNLIFGKLFGPAGSTAYNLSARGPIIPIGSNITALTPISPFRPRRWQGALLPHSAVIDFEILDPQKRPVGASADSHEVKDAMTVTVSEDRSRFVRVLFDEDHSFEERIIREQFAF